MAHTDFVTTFRTFKASHFSYASALVLNLIVYRYFIVAPDVYFSVTWPTWLFVLDLLFSPSLFNFMAFVSVTYRDISAIGSAPADEK